MGFSSAVTLEGIIRHIKLINKSFSPGTYNSPPESRVFS